MKRRVEQKDLYDLHLLSGLQASLRADTLVYVHSQMQEEDDRYERSLWLMDKTHSLCIYQKQPFDAFLWEDENTLLIQKPYADKKTSFYRLHLQDLHCSKAFSLPYKVVQIQRMKEGLYAFLAEENVQKQNDDDTIVLTQIPFWDNGSGYISGKRNHLYVWEETTQRLLPLLQGDWHVEHMAASDAMVVCSAQEFSGKKSVTQGIYAFYEGTWERLELLHPSKLRIDAVVCENEDVVFVGASGKAFGIEEAGSFYRWDACNGVRKLLDSEYYTYCTTVTDCHVGSTTSVLLKEGIVYHLKSEEGRCRLYALDKNGKDVCLTPEANVVRDVAVLETGWYTLETDVGALEEICVYDEDGQRRVCTHWNSTYLKTHEVAQAEEVFFVNSAGRRQKGWVLYPYGYEEGKTYPGLLSIHGGPRGAFGNVFHHEMQVFAAQGYIVFYTNPRGSDSYGEAYADLRGKYGTIDYDDLMDFTDTLLRQLPSLDEKRLGVLGGSYGGFMTNWIIGHTNRFAAAVSQRSVANWISDFGTSCIGYTFDPNEMQATPWMDVERMWKASPLAYADQVTTPTLFLHSLEDYNCPLQEGLQMFTALRYHGVESRMCLFPSENHELSRSGKPKHRLRRLQEMLDWFAAYLQEE